MPWKGRLVVGERVTEFIRNDGRRGREREKEREKVTILPCRERRRRRQVY
jgi:hypothetical protein